MINVNNLQILITLLILLMALGSATWNMLVKTHQNPLTFVTLMTIPQIIIALPFALTHFLQSPTALFIIMLSSLTQTIYVVLLAKAYSKADLSIVYPIGIGLAPLLSFSFLHLIYDEMPHIGETIGILIICFGVTGFSFLNSAFWHIPWKTKIHIFFIGILIATYGLLDSYGVRLENSFQSYISWLFVIKGLMLLIPVAFLKEINLSDLYVHGKNYIYAGILAGLGYAVAIWAFYYAITPFVLSLRTSSIVFAVLLGRMILKERLPYHTIFLSIIIVIGIGVAVIYQDL